LKGFKVEKLECFGCINPALSLNLVNPDPLLECLKLKCFWGLDPALSLNPINPDHDFR